MGTRREDQDQTELPLEDRQQSGGKPSSGVTGAGSGSDPTKLRGGYYTPSSIAEFLARWAIRASSDRVLEPSCGDGQIVEPAAARLGQEGKIVALELFGSEAQRASTRAGSIASVITTDAFSWYLREMPDASFDAVLGNPPFIRYQSFPDAHRDAAFMLMRQEGLHPTRLTNAWLPFVVLATRALKPGGRLALVLPAELLQVSYAGELRGYLARRYADLTVVTFRRLVFDDIQQETVLLLGVRRDCDDARMSFVELSDLDELDFEAVTAAPQVALDLDHAREKWTQYYLSSDELPLIREVEHSEAFTTLGSLADVDVGIVTGRNDFFVMTESQARDRNLHEFCLPLVGRSAQIPGLVLSPRDWESLARDDGKCLLLQIGDVPRVALPAAARAYIDEGERAGVHEGYKCRVRLPRWWNVPSVWAPDAFLLRQIHDAPRIIENRAQTTCTDTIHRVRVRPGVSPAALAMSSLNSLTLAFSEIRGRSYGGGVLELEPTEAEALPFPKLNGQASADDLDLWLRRKGVEETLQEVDRQVLLPAGLSRGDIYRLRGIWRKLFERRMRRKRR